MFSFTVLLSTCQFSALWNFNKIVNNAVSISQLAACLTSQAAVKRVLILIWLSQNGQKQLSYKKRAEALQQWTMLKNYCLSRLTFLLIFYFRLFWKDWGFFATETSINTIATLFTWAEPPTFLSSSIYFSLNSYICILILSSVTVKEEGDITELDNGDTWWGEWGRWLLSALSFNSFLNPNCKACKEQGFCSVPSLQSQLSQGTLLHIAAHRKSVEDIIATSWIHVNLEEKEVLVSQVANIPNFHFFQNTVGLITSNIVSIKEVNIATSEEVKSLV